MEIETEIKLTVFTIVFIFAAVLSFLLLRMDFTGGVGLPYEYEPYTFADFRGKT